MKIIALAVAAVALISTPVLADQWKVLGADGEKMMAVDLDTIDRSGANPYAWVSFAHAWSLEDDTDYTISYMGFDCERDLFRYVTIRAFRNGRVPNGTFDNYDWEPVLFGTWGEDLFRIVCGLDVPDGRNIRRTADQHQVPIEYIQAVQRGDFN